ncbi:S-adenosyl-L-methionine-dependent methyltransferase [Aspergillus caelatus]|uniref:S-adenosyl-L-methionine-dependent methyltransferase n=1 Tax=Aspergillus caelatus TaxID=61420 RepID=A0A5N7AEF1_9EURO|nr:S-adenosyl-L-methionine-dependent methyltransferase [Aspergillus caelatus]KAE8367010.1 S-adenosyl-L-methionine-dependent methyltransferase [Aspergillus caelatus]
MNGHSDIVSVLNGVTPASLEDEDQRSRALLAAYALVARLETPWETMARLCMGQPALGAALKVCKDLELFEKWDKAGNEAMNADELAKLTPCEAALLERLLRHLASNHMLHEPSVGVFKPTPFTKSLLQPVFGEWINHLYDATLPCFSRLPEYLAQTGYKVPLDPANGVFQYTKDWKGDMFHYYEVHPREGESFNHVMGGVMANQAGWLDIFPHERLLETAAEGTPLVVDVGGNIGHDMERFLQAHPETASRLYLQDRPEVVKLSKCPDPVSKMGYDFFTPQPVKGSRVYYMHGVLHDWSDEPARKILAMQREALTPGYSTLLIHDHIASRALAHPHTTAYDLTMMVMVAGTERTEEHWETLLQSEGYKVVKIWRSPLAVQGIIEAELA